MPRLPGERLARILVALAGADHADGSLTTQLCLVSIEVVGVSGAAASVISDGQANELVAASDDVSGQLAELEFSLGEGPGTDAHRDGRPVLEADLTRPDLACWPAFSDAALAAGARAVFAFPLRLGAIRLGTLVLYRTTPGRLHPDAVADGLVLGRLLTEAILAVQANAPPGMLHPDLAVASPHRLVIHQATGMVAAQLGIGVGEAFVRLRAHAFADARSLADVAADVVNHALRFEDLQ